MKQVTCLIAACAFTSVSQAQQVPTAELRGRVISRTEQPLVGAEIRILRESMAAITDSAGRFVLRQVPPGQQVVLVRRIGFQPQYLSTVFRDGESREVTVALAPGAYQLPEIEVTAIPSKPLEYAYTTKYDEFFRRQRIGLGHYISRQDIDRKMSAQTPELLLGMPGVRVWLGAPGLTPSAVKLRSCANVSVWVDGFELKTFKLRAPIKPMMGDPVGAAEETGEKLERILPLQIEMIEIYAGPSQMPAETVGNSCAAIMIWTR